MGALSMRRLEERNTLFALPGTGDTFGAASVVVERYERGRIASLTIGSLEAAAKEGQAPLYKVADIKATGVDLGREIAALSADTWRPGAPTGRVHVDNISASGFGGEMLARYGISLGGVSLETVREGDKISRSRTRVEGFVLAPPLRSLEGLQMRVALQTMGLKEVKADLDCAGTDDRSKGEFSLDRCALVESGPGRNRSQRADRPGRPGLLARRRRWRHPGPFRIEGGAGLGAADAGRQEPAGAGPEGPVDRHRPAGIGDAGQSGARHTPLSALGRADLAGHDRASRHRCALRRAGRHAHHRRQARASGRHRKVRLPSSAPAPT